MARMSTARRNPVAWQNFYKTARWRRLREFQLARDVSCVVPDAHAEGKTFAQDAQLKSIAACRTITQRLNLEEEIHHTASKLRILRFEPRK
jgi:hypothetical protein